MTISEIVALASVLISVGMNVGVYVHLSSSMPGDWNQWNGGLTRGSIQSSTAWK